MKTIITSIIVALLLSACGTLETKKITEGAEFCREHSEFSTIPGQAKSETVYCDGLKMRVYRSMETK